MSPKFHLYNYRTEKIATAIYFLKKQVFSFCSQLNMCQLYDVATKSNAILDCININLFQRTDDNLDLSAWLSLYL